MDKQLEIYKMSEDIPRKVSDNYGFPENQLLGAVQRNEIAEVLIDKGYRKPPVYIGDTVYFVYDFFDDLEDWHLEPWTVSFIAYNNESWYVGDKDMYFVKVGTTEVFLSLKEAEEYLEKKKSEKRK